MKKIVFALAIMASSISFVSCTADSISDETSQMNLSADDSGGSGDNGTVPPIKPPPPSDTGFGK